MRVRTATGWVVAAGVLGVVALVMAQGAKQRGIKSSVSRLAFDPAGVVEVTLRHPDGAVVRVDRTSGVWGWSFEVEYGDEAHSWFPVADASVRSGLRRLVTARFDGRAARSKPQEGWSRLTVRQRDGEEHTLAFAQNTEAIGGRVPGECDGQPVWVESILTQTSERDGITGWRERRVMRRLGAGPDGLEIKAGEASLQLQRTRGRWRVVEPVKIEADEAMVGKMLEMIEGITIDAFTNDLWTAQRSMGRGGMSLGGPTIRLHTTVRGEDAPLEITRTLRLWQGGQTPPDRFSGLFEIDSGDERRGRPMDISLKREHLDKIVASPEAYIRREAAALRAGDFGGLELVDARGELAWRVRRAGGGWVDAGGGPLSQADGEELALLLALLTQAQATDVRLVEGDDWDAEPGATGRLQRQTPDGAWVELLEARVSRGEQTELMLSSPPLTDADGTGSRRIVWSYRGPSVERIVGRWFERE